MGNETSTPQNSATNELMEVSNENKQRHQVILLGYENSRMHSTLNLLTGILVSELKILNLRFTFKIGSLKEIHTEVYAYGYIFSFAQDDGLRCAQVSRHWLYETTKGKFGEYSAAEKSID